LPRKYNKFSLIARYDYLDPDDEIANNSHYTYIYGLSYKFNDNVRFLIDNDVTDYDGNAVTNDANKILLQTQVKF